MNIGEIGNVFSTTTKIDYLSDQTFIEFDFLIISYPFLLQKHSPANKKEFEKRKNLLLEFIHFKKVPIIIFSPKERIVNFTINGRTANFHLNFFLPVPEFEVQNESGEKISIVPNTVFFDFLKKYQSYFRYSSFFSLHSGKTIMQMPHTNKTLSFYNEQSLFLPELKQNIKEIEKEFLNDLIASIEKINKTEVFKFPPWSEEYFLPGEKKAVSILQDTQNKIDGLIKKMDEEKKHLNNLISKKILFIGTGNHLEFEIEKIFVELGFEILEKIDNRDDLIAKYNDKICVVEIKGVVGSSSEKQAAQLEKWVSTYFAENNIEPKGILIVNSFREKPLEDRNSETTWPNQMLTYCKRKELCLITSLQLLALYFEALEKPTEKDNLINSLFTTIGVYPDFNEWEKFITTKNNTPVGPSI